MTPDQIQRIDDLTEKLADVFLREADPDNWTAPGTMPADMSTEQRGNRFWDRKGASATGSVLRFALDIADRNNQKDAPLVGDDMDEEIAKAEKRADSEMRRVLGSAAARATMTSGKAGK